MASKTETPYMDSYFFTKIDNFSEIVDQARAVDPDRVDELVKSRQNLCDVLDQLQCIIDSKQQSLYT